MENEALNEDDKYPIIYGNLPYFTLELTNLSKIAFCVADDPFYKSLRAKYYPEVILISSKSEIKSIISHDNRANEKQTLEYCEDFREQALKFNDDRKVKINLSDLKGKGTAGKMLLLIVKCFSLRKQPPKQGEFDRAWFRIINEDTNQTIDYKNIKSIEKPEGFDEDAPVTAEEGQNQEELEAQLPTITYVAGRIFLDASGRWVYESFNHCFTSDKNPQLIEKIAEIHRTSEEELAF